MDTRLNATFDMRRNDGMTVERMVREHGLERTHIFLAASGDQNTAGQEQAGSGAFAKFKAADVSEA